MGEEEKKDILLQTFDIKKSFGTNDVLKGINFALKKGEVHAMLGQNGAGKSTFIKMLSGALLPDSGSIFVEGKKFCGLTPSQSFELGIATIYQETSLYPDLSVAENLFVGKRKKRHGFLDWKTMVSEANEIFGKLGVEISPYAKLREFGKATAQLVEIARALLSNAKILIMDEPTASLSASETENLFAVIEKLKAEETSIIYISHRLDEVFRISDRMLILRDGVVAADVSTAQVDHGWVVETMIGRHVEQLYPTGSRKQGEVLLEVSHLTHSKAYRDVSFTVNRGEIVALAGLVGSGRTEVARAIFGIDRYDSGTIRIAGEEVKHQPWDVINQGIGMVPEDRGRQGLVLDMTAADNFIAASLERISHASLRNFKKENSLVRRLSEDMTLRPNNTGLPAKSYSGGNQQKVVIGKWLATNPRLLILDEPTCGVDVGARYEVYKIMEELVCKGMAILIISSDFPEIEHIADRIYVMRKGEITKELPHGSGQELILKETVG
jgi:ABC-type sugar transport system ATPase subunit